MDDSDTVDTANIGIATSRSKRDRPDKFGRLAALQKLRGLKGTKNKYEVAEVEAVYEEVDEKEYSRRRKDKMEDDWIIDDDGSGYVEDGREIFDEEDDDDIFTSKKAAKKEKKHKSSSKGNIKNMLINMPVKKRKAENDVGLDEDELLGDILFDLGASGSSPSVGSRPSLSKRPRPSTSPTHHTSYSSPMNPFANKHRDSPSTPRQINPINSPKPTPKQIESTNDMCSPKPTPKQYGNRNSLLNRKTDAATPIVIGQDTNKGVTPIMTTPVRTTNRQPRAVLRENALVDSPPKAKRSITADKVHNNPAPAKGEDSVQDFLAMDFSALDDEDFMEDVQRAEDQHNKEKQDKSVEDNQDKPANRGFTTSARQKSTPGSAGAAGSGWGSQANVEDNALPQHVVPELSLDTSALPLVAGPDGKQVLRMYWLDAWEDQYRQPGTVYLFGKVHIEAAKTHVSCCVTVRNISRRVWLLPRQQRINVKTSDVINETVTMKDVYDEFNERIAARYNIKEFKSRPVTKSYAFEKMEVPNEAEYLEVRYSCAHDALPGDLVGETFSHVFGHTATSLEVFLMDHKIRGPCWLDVSSPHVPKPAVSWCKVEAVANTPSLVKITSSGSSGPPPPVVVLTLTIRTSLNPATHQSEVAAIGCLVHHTFPLDKQPPQPPFTQHFCVLTKPSDVIWPWDFKTEFTKYRHTKIEKQDSERALLGFFLARLQQLDPDVIVGHDVIGYDLGIILHRISANKIPHWSRLGRLKRTVMPKLSSRGGYAEKSAVCGRLLCDIKLSAKELIRAKSYELSPLAAQVLRVPEEEAVSPQQIKKMYDSSDSLLQLVSLTMQSSFHVVRLLCELNVLPLALQITNIAGNVMSRTLVGGRSDRNEFLLLHAFTEKGYIPPDKLPRKGFGPKEGARGNDEGEASGPQRKKASYAGGLVLEPKKGFYDKYILLMDFNSLYPSIIQEYNICFTTIDRQSVSTAEDGDQAGSAALPEPDQAPGVLPTEIRKLVESRRTVKSLMKAQDLTPDQLAQFDIRQKALKLTANSMYGCLGFNGSRFYAAHLAAMVTGKGREILLNTRDLVQRLNFDVIYGDTDSIMINTNCTDYEQVFKLGHKIKLEVNKLYKQLELEVDGVFKYMLLLKKKKYAALTMTKLPNGKVIAEPELKGLDIVRRDWSALAANAGRKVVDYILSDLGQDERLHNIHSHLEELGTSVREGKVELSSLVITKQLTKRPEDYPDKAALAHVQVALRLNATSGAKKLKQGDTVPYVICDDKTANSISLRAYHPDELKSNSALTIDTAYYLAHQLHPVVARLCDPIDGSDAARIAECLGLDPANYRASRQYQGGDGDEDSALTTELPPEERYRGCDRYSFSCPAPGCDTKVTMDDPFREGLAGRKEPHLASCPNPKCQRPIYATTTPLLNALTQQMRGHVTRYYSGWLVCEDPGCSNRTRRVPLQFVRGFPVCNLCQKGVLIREYTESQLYKQLCFYDHIFDFQKACQLTKDDRIRDDSLRRSYVSLRTEVQRFLNMSAYSQVNLGSLFANLCVKNTKG